MAPPIKYTNSELLKILARELKLHGLPKNSWSKRFNRKNNLPSVSIYYTRFGGMNKAATLVNYDLKPHKKICHKVKITTINLLQELRKFIRVFHRIPKEIDFKRKYGRPSFVVYQKRFGSWNAAINLVAKTSRTFQQGHVVYTQKELKYNLKKWCSTMGRLPKCREVPALYRYRFGTWNQGLKEIFNNINIITGNDSANLNKMILDLKLQGMTFSDICSTLSNISPDTIKHRLYCDLGFGKHFTTKQDKYIKTLIGGSNETNFPRA